MRAMHESGGDSADLAELHRRGRAMAARAGVRLRWGPGVPAGLACGGIDWLLAGLQAGLAARDRRGGRGRRRVLLVDVSDDPDNGPMLVMLWASDRTCEILASDFPA